MCAAFGWFGLVYFGELASVEEEHAKVKKELEEKSVKATYYDKLEANRKDYLSRVQTVQEIGQSRRLWSKFLDELFDVVNNNGDSERHQAWFDSLTVHSDKSGPTVTMPGAVLGGEMTKVANLHEDLEAAPFAKDLQSKSDPVGKLDTDKKKTPAESMRFNLQMQLMGLLPEKPKPKPAPAAVPPAEKK